MCIRDSVALFIVVLLVAVHLVGMAGVAAPQPLGQDAAQHKVQHETNDDSCLLYTSRCV